MNPIAALTPLQRRILVLLCVGCDTEEIASATNACYNTTRWRRDRVLELIGARNAADAIRIAIKHRLIVLSGMCQPEASYFFGGSFGRSLLRK